MHASTSVMGLYREPTMHARDMADGGSIPMHVCIDQLFHPKQIPESLRMDTIKLQDMQSIIYN